MATTFANTMSETLRNQVQRVLSGRGSKLEKIERLMYDLYIPYREAINIVETYYNRTERQHRQVQAVREFKAENFTFGVELECVNVNKAILIEKLREKGIAAFAETYNHNDNDRYYKIVSDGSLVGRNTAEIVSPVLRGKQGLDSLKIVCDTLAEIGATVNRSCGLHIHLGANTFDIHRWRNILVNYARLENIIDNFMPLSRRANNNTFCKSLRLLPVFENNVLHSGDLYDLRNLMGSRYYKVNLEAFFRHSTIEFRQHAGTIEFKKIEMWLSFLQKLVTYSKDKSIENVTTIEQIPFLNNKEKDYFKARSASLND